MMPEPTDDSALLRQLAQDMAVVRSTLGRIEKRDDDTEGRLRRLERWMYLAVGMATASGVGTLAALLGQTPVS